MPMAFILNLECLEDGALYGFTGQHNYRFWQGYLRRFVDELALRSVETSVHKALAISPLFETTEMRHRRTPLLMGDTAQMRVAVLSDELAPVLLEYMYGQIGTTVEIGEISWRIQSIIDPGTEDPEVDSETYQDLLYQSRRAHEMPSQWQFSFITPMALRHDYGGYLAFPLPHQLIQTWLDRWERMTYPNDLLGIDSIDDFVARVSSKAAITRYALKAVGTSLMYDESLPEAGCTGKATLRAHALERSEAEILAALMRYSFYCGSGVCTELGMGQTRLLRTVA